MSAAGDAGVGPSLTRLGESVPEPVEICEVGPRDGLQNELRAVSTDDKLRLVDALVAAGLHRIELTAFVSPRWIPQLADADALAVRARARHPAVRFSALVPNLRGLERAQRAGLSEVAFFLSASESHSRRNTNRSVAEALRTWRAVAREARAAGQGVRCYVSTVWGCPYEGELSVERVLEVVKAVVQEPCDELSLGDTLGVGTPLQTSRILDALTGVWPVDRLALHLHDTRGTALVNALVGLARGVRRFDASVGGLGGCPYAPGASGNLATEDLVYLLRGMGASTGVDLSRLVEAGRLAQEIVGRRLSGKVLQAELSTSAQRRRDAPPP